MAEVPKTSPQHNKPGHLHHLFSLLTCFCRVCLPVHTSQDSLITNLCLESTATHRAAHETKRIRAHLAPYALLSVSGCKSLTRSGVRKHKQRG